MIDIVYAASTVASGTTDTNQGTAALTQFANFIWDRVDNWMAAAVLMFLSIYFAKFFKNIVVSKISDKQLDEAHDDVIVLAGRATYFGILSVGITIALKVAGIDITAIIAAAGFGIGFALQDLIMNFIAGILILLNHPFKLGDYIKVNDITGKVVEIQSRATVLQGFDGIRIVVPNSDVINKQVISYTSNPFRRVEVLVSVDYGADIKKAMEICLALVEADPKINKQPKPSINISEYGDSSIDMKLWFWIDSRSSWIKAKSQIMEQVLHAFDEAKIEIPYNKMDINLFKPEDANLENLKENDNKSKSVADIVKKVVAQKNDFHSDSIIEDNVSNVDFKQEVKSENTSPVQIEKIEIVHAPLVQDFVIPPVEQNKDKKGGDFLNGI
ncbi:MAG: MscS Mechanosensitive ion channel, small conductance mechanosensitive channel [Candidatus Peregrinibacteria bacterium GW2011_GWF2_33_10]|nr:MAG: MscS Mechanosensitive ion channel, small conductance mechanosensitive channel [Candidatus Peregrinibacteria bacterium GW2011_GWF2_33_10]OGJ44215.1 MAG: hypothetical protein A2263_04540 [Candidatus Peregrinibacteria bacterium RIFOXYA2_FULL_33_21]OGJ46699.1 MAG: hypothetical protein A2272_04800 [Candidatus Peregrinibacteria bacterium RIFOXYA12_FULL_33_12]OGJ51844.1 MAG: hypothetical protein A2307_05205 [Candidatus Peregrinibacteria bacterium RIFOXYB2_FULL_33_20]